VTGAFSSNPLNVFGVNTESVHDSMVAVVVDTFVRIN